MKTTFWRPNWRKIWLFLLLLIVTIGGAIEGQYIFGYQGLPKPPEYRWVTLFDLWIPSQILNFPSLILEGWYSMLYHRMHANPLWWKIDSIVRPLFTYFITPACLYFLICLLFFARDRWGNRIKGLWRLGIGIALAAWSLRMYGTTLYGSALGFPHIFSAMLLGSVIGMYVYIGICLGGLLLDRVSQAAGRRGISRKLTTRITYGLLAVGFWLSLNHPNRVGVHFYGMTVYSGIPYPIVDLTIRPGGTLRIRDSKKHWISLEEFEKFVGSDPKQRPEVVVIGDGYSSRVEVDEQVYHYPGIEVEVFPTSDAVERYNRFRAEGRRIALILHSTC